jgi:DNA-binding MarR family transcriptional regulator
MARFKPAAAAVYWYLSAHGEARYQNQQELADLVGIAYGTLKDGIRELRAAGLIEGGRRIELKRGVPPE